MTGLSLIFVIGYFLVFPHIHLFFFLTGLLLFIVVTGLFCFSLLFVLGCLRDITYIKSAK